MYNPCKIIENLSVPPKDPKEYACWLKQKGVLKFLADNIQSDEIVVYASLAHTFIHGVQVPRALVDPLDTDDVLRWSGNPHSSWSITSSEKGMWVEAPLSGFTSKTISQGEQLIFCRSFEGVPERRSYIEISQKFTHLCGLHFMSDRDSWCRLDRHGDIADMVRVYQIPATEGRSAGIVVTMRREILAQYSALTQTTFVRMFDFTRFRPMQFDGWASDVEEIRTDGNSIFYRFRIMPEHASYSMGIQISDIAATQETALRRIMGGEALYEANYATFIAHDWKNQRITELSCDPNMLANYFTKSHLPYEITPAFFRPEVLLKYKSDREKYRLLARSVTCRNTWTLKTFDVNEAGQVHTYLIYLSHLPYEEQLHWKQYNEPPKAPISVRARKTDIEGDFSLDPDPLQDLKHQLELLRNHNVSWWTLRDQDLPDRVQYPVTASVDEWKEEILGLDQLIVEGFEEKWLRKKAKGFGREPNLQFRSLKLIEECLVGIGFDEDHARTTVAPLHDLRNLRNIVKGHASGEKAKKLKSNAISEHGSLRNHFQYLCGTCGDAIETISEAFKDPPFA